MAKVEDCPGFETFGADVKAAREAKRLARKTLAEMVGIEWRYLANIENQGAIPSLPAPDASGSPASWCGSARRYIPWKKAPDTAAARSGCAP